VVNFQKGSFLQPKLTFFAKIKQETGVHAAHRVMDGPQSFHIDFRVSVEPVDVRNDPHQGRRLQTVCARKREFGHQKRPSEVFLLVRLKLQNWVNFIIELYD